MDIGFLADADICAVDVMFVEALDVIDECCS